MKRYRVIRDGKVTNEWFSTFADEKYYEPGFGKPERWVTELSGEDITQAIETRQVEVSPAILDEQGVEVEPAKFVTEYKLAAEYTIEIEDISNELERQRINQESLAYLASTDWYVIRQQEAGTPIPQDILEARAAARAAIVR